MSEEKEIQKQSDEKENEKEELSEQDLKPVSGGAFDIFVQFGDIPGESSDNKSNTLARNPYVNPILIKKVVP
jgi:hypothetical protein